MIQKIRLNEGASRFQNFKKISNFSIPTTYDKLSKFMEACKSRLKIIRVARKCQQPPPSLRSLHLTDNTFNIFTRKSLELSPIINLEPGYKCVGLSEVKQYIKRGKKVHKKYTHGGTISTSLKSYTVKANETEEVFMTKFDVLNMQKINKAHCSMPSSPKKANQNPIRQNSTIKSPRLKLNHFRIKSNEFTLKLDQYQQKIEKLNQYTLKEKKQNIPSTSWTKILRQSISLSQIHGQQREKYDIVKRKGFKIVAQSKKNKQIRWIQGQKDGTLFEPVDGKLKLRESQP